MLETTFLTMTDQMIGWYWYINIVRSKRTFNITHRIRVMLETIFLSYNYPIMQIQTCNFIFSHLKQSKTNKLKMIQTCNFIFSYPKQLKTNKFKILCSFFFFFSFSNILQAAKQSSSLRTEFPWLRF
jgi:hypothetical protein